MCLAYEAGRSVAVVAGLVGELLVRLAGFFGSFTALDLLDDRSFWGLQHVPLPSVVSRCSAGRSSRYPETTARGLTGEPVAPTSLRGVQTKVKR